MAYNPKNLNTQNSLLMCNLMKFYENKSYLEQMVNIVNGNSLLSLRIIDWFVTNYSKKHYIIYRVYNDIYQIPRFKVYNEYKLRLKAYGKIKFDPFCRWIRINIPYDNDNYIETTIGQLNFFKWAIENDVLKYIEDKYDAINLDMNNRNTTSRRKKMLNEKYIDNFSKTRKVREELSVSACKCIKTENVNIILKF
jgi:hypothetical protein